MTTNGHGDHYGNDDPSVIDPPDAALRRLVGHFAELATSLQTALPRLSLLTGDARTYLVGALRDQLVELGCAAIDAAPELERLYGPANEPFKPR